MAPLSSRKIDIVYLIFFIIHVPIVLIVDLYPLYPTHLIPSFMTSLRTWYIATYRDQFFTSPPAWFTFYTWMEFLYHLPLCLWAIPAILRDDPLVPLHLLVYAMQTAVTTATCVADFVGWNGFSTAEKGELAKLYVPYLGLSVLMGWDMFRRLSTRLTSGRIVDGRMKKVN